MRRGTLYVAPLMLGLSAPVMAQAPIERVTAICGPAVDTKREISGSASLSLISKILSAIGIQGQYKTETNSRLSKADDRVGALEAMGMICRVIESDNALSVERKVEILTGWASSMLIYQQKKSEWDFNPVKVIPVVFHHATFPAVRENQVQRVAELPNTITSPPPPPPPNAPIFKIFPKSDLGIDKILELRRLLPDFDIRQGRSGLSGSRYPAEVLFANRKKVSEGVVVEALRALAKVGVHIKSVQQTNRPDDLQVGNIVPGANHPAFAKSVPLDIEKLASLKGDEFWRQAFNGQAWCDVGPEKTKPCHISKDGKPM